MPRLTIVPGLLALVTLSSAAALAVTADVAVSNVASTDCRCFPGDACWPTSAEWSSLNETFGGRLIATIPLAAACHDDQYASYDEERCTELQNSWLDPETQ